MDTPYTYIFIRKDLAPEQQIVQASHAALEAGFRFDQPEKTSHIVLIGIDGQDELQRISSYLLDQNILHEMFFEPDYDTGYTSIATQPIYGEQRKPLKKFPLHRL